MPVEMVLTFDGKTYSTEEIQKAAYRGSRSFTIGLTCENENKIQCILTPNTGINDQEFTTAVETFKKDVLDYHLRTKIKAETTSIRNLILGLAFSKTGALQRLCTVK